MIVFKNKDGFTLIEVLLALAIIGLVLGPIFASQTLISQSSRRVTNLFSQLFSAKKMLLETGTTLDPAQAIPVKIEKKINKPDTVLTYQLKKIPDNSALKNFKNVFVESVSWPTKTKTKKSQQLVTFVYRPEPTHE